MVLKVSAPDGVKVYNVSSGKTLPEWLAEGKRRSLQKNEEYRRRLELIQDFAFPAACQRIRVTPDEQYIFCSGYHPPMVKVFDVNNLSLKFDRHLDEEIVDFQILSEDFSKAVFLCADRSLAFHARYGAHTKLRVPRCGRALTYLPFTAELLVAGSAPELYRISLQAGRFMTPLPSKSPAVNAVDTSEVHGLVACAGEDGTLECFDLRQKQSVGALEAASESGHAGEGLTAVKFDSGGLHLATGTSGGVVSLWDLRASKPLIVKDHMYGTRITSISFHVTAADGNPIRRVISSDSRIIKIWDQHTGAAFTNIEPPDGDINQVCSWGSSGLLMVGCDAPKVQAFFLPSLGPAPRWCSFLESITEELEESAPSLYDDYRFVTRPELTKLGLDHLVGTSVLRAYMHGYFVDNRLYHKAKNMVQPFAYEEYRQKAVAKKLEAERNSRISIVRKLPKVNAAVAARLLHQEDEGEEEGGRRKKARKGEAGPDGKELLEDERFKAMFEDEEFAVDEASAEYRMLHPNARKEGLGKKLLAEHFQEVDDWVACA